jgi:hypothetical protein
VLGIVTIGMKRHSDHSVKEKPFSTSKIGVCSGAEAESSLSLHLFVPASDFDQFFYFGHANSSAMDY